MFRSAFFALALLLWGAFAEEDAGKSYYEACADATIAIQDLSVLCDSPGAYYYGGSKYRNSPTCQMGDKIRVQASFYITEDLEADPYFSIKLASQDSDHDDIYIFQEVDLCGVSGLSSQNGEECPSQGYYDVSVADYVWEKDSNSGDEFYPDVEVGFRSDTNNWEYDLGGANTNRCPGDRFSSWTSGPVKDVANKLVSFLVTFGTLLLAICSVVYFIFFIINSIQRSAEESFPNVDDDLLEGHYQQVVMMSDSRNLVHEF